jgi:oligoendopeptidase F
MSKSVPPRSKINKKYTWNAESVFKTPKEWEAETKSIVESLPGVKAHQGKLGESAGALADGLKAIEDLILRAYRVYMYASFSSSVDTGNQKASAMSDRAQGVFGMVLGTISFLDPELLSIGEQTLRVWVKEEPRLHIYGHYVDDLFRKQAHVRSAEVEEVLGMLADPFGGASNATNLLVNADFKFAPGVDGRDRKVEVAQSAQGANMSNLDRKARQTTWESYADKHLEFKNTLASNLATSIKQNVFAMRARKHTSTLEMSLFDNHIPVEVFHNLIDTFKKNLPVWHRYFEIRRKGLGLKTALAPYDMWAPLTTKKTKVTYEQAVNWIAEGLTPLGNDYAATIRKGCLQERWVDVYPNQGKFNGAFSAGAPGTYPFIMMSFGGDVSGLSTLAHELGHSMHSYLTWQNQPFVYSNYSLFVAEVASNFHQAMVRGYLLNNTKDKNFQIALIEEAMANFFRYFFIMPTLARFELETHQRVERGEPLTADGMTSLMADLFGEAYGPKVKMDRNRVGITWATFGHLFSDYYVYQYATGISGAHALSSRILRDDPNAAQDYVKFLKAGASLYPLDALKLAGVDLTTPKPVEETFDVMSGYIDRLESLIK